jgi:hypothetical protein
LPRAASAIPLFACGLTPAPGATSSSRVDNLDLKKLGLAGELPASSSSLAALKDLNLQVTTLKD